MTTKVFATLKDALVTLNGGALVFAEEFDATRDARRFVVCSDAATYWKRFSALSRDMRRVHEIIQFDKPCRLVLDIETTIPTKDRELDVVGMAVEKIRTLVGKEQRCIVLDSSRCVRKGENELWKASYHVVFPDMVFASPAHVSAYVYEALGTPEIYYVDVSIYRMRGSLRTVYSRSFRSDVHLTPVGVSRDAPMDMDVFFACLVTVPSASVTHAPKALVVERRDDVRVVDNVYRERALAVMEKFLLAKYSAVPTVSIDVNCNSIDPLQVSVYVGGVECPFARRIHASNRMLFSVQLMPEALVADVQRKWCCRVGVRWMCLDASCRGCVASEPSDVVHHLSASIYS